MGKYGKDMKKFVGYFGKWLNLFSCSQVKRWCLIWIRDIQTLILWTNAYQGFFIAKNLVIWNKNSIFALWNNDLVAQLVCVCLEHLPFKQGVVGSNPTGVTRISSVVVHYVSTGVHDLVLFWKIKIKKEG